MFLLYAHQVGDRQSNDHNKGRFNMGISLLATRKEDIGDSVQSSASPNKGENRAFIRLISRVIICTGAVAEHASTDVAAIENGQ